MNPSALTPRPWTQSQSKLSEPPADRDLDLRPFRRASQLTMGGSLKHFTISVVKHSIAEYGISISLVLVLVLMTLVVLVVVLVLILVISIRAGVLALVL